MRPLIALLCLAACDLDVPVLPDAPPDAMACKGEVILGPYSDLDPLYGEACPVDAAGCRPSPEWPGGYAGACVFGQCRPICGYGDNGFYAAQCCLRGGRQIVTTWGLCVCMP